MDVWCLRFLHGGGQLQTDAHRSIESHLLWRRQQADAGKIRVYPAGKPASFQNVVLTATTGKSIEVLTGTYDVKVIGTWPIWSRGVVIEQDKLTAIKLGGLGILTIGGSDKAGKPIRAGIAVYLRGSKRISNNIVAIGKLNQPLRVIAGTYDVRVDLRPDIWFDAVEIVHGKTTDLRLPKLASLQISVADADGKPLKEYVYITGLGDKKNIGATRKTNTEISMPPGRYDIQVGLKPKVYFRGIEFEAGRMVKLEIPQRGRLLVRLSNGLSQRIYIHRPNVKNKVVVGGKTNKPITIAPGACDFSVKIGGKWQFRKVVIERGKKTTLIVPVK